MRIVSVIFLVSTFLLPAKPAAAWGDFVRTAESLEAYHYGHVTLIDGRRYLRDEVTRYFYPRYQFRRVECYYDEYMRKWHGRGHIVHYGRISYPCWRRNPKYYGRRYWK